MAESITFNNAVYIIPDVGESNWGQNLTNYFVAIPQGAYQASGGTLPLTADLSFGTNFGLFTKYVTSVTAAPAGAGAIRLAKTDSVDWRNNANAANLALAIDGSDNLTYNGNIISGSAAGPVVSVSGTTNQITASPTTGAVILTVPSTFIAPGSIQATTTLKGTTGTLTNTTNQIILGTTNTVTLSSTAPAASRVYTVPDAGGAANVVLDAGNYTIGGTWSFSNSITLASSKALILTDNSTSTVTLKATNTTTSWTLNLPTTHGTSNQFLQTDGSGNTTWASGGNGTIVSSTAGNLSLFPSTGTTISDTYVQNTHNITLGIATQASRSANLAITIPNPGNAITTANIVLDQGAYTIAGALTLSSTLTMSGATIAMGSQKITGLANGTTSTDAAAFGQIFTGFQAPVISNSNTNFSTSSTTYVTTNCTASITPTSSAHRIKITFSGVIITAASTADTIQLTLARATTDLSAGNGFAQVNTATGTAVLAYPVSVTFIDSPATTSATTYNVRILTQAGLSIKFGNGLNTPMILEEIV